MVRFVLILSLCFVLFSFNKEGEVIDMDSTLKIQLSNIRNDEGVVYVFVYCYENQYPYEPYKYYKFKKTNVKNGLLSLNIKGLDQNKEYAITLIDDENSNDDLDRWLGLPKEGFGFSNNVKPLFSLPKYSDLTFEYNSSKVLNVKLQYLL